MDGQGKPANGTAPRLGFVVEIVGFGHRDGEQKRNLRHRLDELLSGVVADLGAHHRADAETSDDTHLVFLPADPDSARVLPAAITSVADRLGRDNRRYRTRMRLRMSVGVGTATDLRLLVGSAVLREAVRDNPGADLALLVRHGDAGHLDPTGLTRVEVAMKESRVPAWLRLYPSQVGKG